ncbi:hypothetical protein M413DRAFT_25718 [Hebeloma cylindrosporum]|uniref:Uncharacterized protein n=1 Tax=Hebeloma cylindrosporum TaxID=76867 RepID=A0A0C3CKH3_HEBCY|nr:hypothetical protein M413DRAFT_25718 [Hebeloma cylindrosporum h7]
MAEACATNSSPDLSGLEGEGDEHLKDVPAVEIWHQTFKRQSKGRRLVEKYNEIVEGEEIEFATPEAESDLYEALEVEALLSAI